MSCSERSWAPLERMRSRTRATSSSVSRSQPSTDSSHCRCAGEHPAEQSAIRAVRLPSLMSSPAGLPVVSGSPNTPRTSSRSWNASPKGRVNVAHAARNCWSAPARAAPMATGCSTEYLADL